MGTRKRSRSKSAQAQNAADREARATAKLQDARTAPVDSETTSSPRGEKERYLNNSTLSTN